MTHERIKGINGPAAKNLRIINAAYSQAGMAAAPSLELIHPGVLQYMREVGLLK